MAIIQNQAIIQKLIDELELSPALEKIPTELAEKILPVFQVNSETLTIQSPTANIVKQVSQTSSGTTTMYTVPSTGKFFLTNAVLQASAKENSTQVALIEVVVDTVKVALLYLGIKPTTTGDTPTCQGLVINLQNPILLTPASIIEITATGTSIRAHGTIVGYTSD